MTFLDIPDGSHVFVDANTFVYHFIPDPILGPACRQLMDRIARQELAAFTSAQVLGDVAHRVMTMEAMARRGWSYAGIASQLKRHPTEIPNLVKFQQAIQEIPLIGIQVLPIAYGLVSSATTLSRQHGLLTGDALIVAVMQANGLTHLASHDADFDRVPGISRYAPA